MRIQWRLFGEENEGNNIETVDSRLGGVNDNIEAVSKVPTEIEYIETEECTDFAGNASVELSQNEDSKVDVDRTNMTNVRQNQVKWMTEKRIQKHRRRRENSQKPP